MPSLSTDIELFYQPPFDWQRLLRFFGGRSSALVETVIDGVYLRTVEWRGDEGLLSVRQDPTRDCLIARIEGPAGVHLPALVPRLRRMFDLDLDPRQLHAALDSDPWLGRLLLQTPGLRVPGTWSTFELIVRTIVGQQVSVKAATTIAGRLAERAGRPVAQAQHPQVAWQFPTPAALAAVDLDRIGMPGKRVAALQNFAAAVACNQLQIEAFVDEHTRTDLEPLRQGLLALPGIGPWTVEYVAMRAWRDADAWPGSDLVIMQEITRAHPELLKPGHQRLRSQDWRPWRAYAVMYIWNELMDRTDGQRGG
ncbi:DNA-3-methyladenine glycosylase 2 family protein [Pseudomonas sp. CFBP 8770]|uniref:DNA-3-methyladenine glycosylase family protein n=1 Tax=unclassified Pseudomonas TaxID=196821 RepID=UPI00177D4764|nr:MULTISPECIES: DNA-3-methyladenine glycosylase 2 family protein [unclassified Pseudomonas]MBD8473163.1 DNA-3-methyladenine glycosylase 2 family protein [Pseudomonas sp. CFBP 8773]MBD8645734.1 DNA-3-methyladenine glycosylase 2 family protein [Pseudomonas sp. CFBP 8770]